MLFTRRFWFMLGMSLLLLTMPAVGRPLPWWLKSQPRTEQTWMMATGSTRAAPTDTVRLLGGPDRLDGRFEDESGLPQWHGWTPVDHTGTADTLWTISTFNAEELGGHGPGNLAMWCGTVFQGDDHGYGNNWEEVLAWTAEVNDPTQGVTVRVRARLSHDTEPGFDRLSLLAGSVEDWQFVASWEGWRIDREVDETFLVSPADLAGPAGNEVQLRFVFTSDEAWSDEDGLYPTDGACQIDDIEVILNEEPVSFDDFEPGNPVSWFPEVTPGVGAFAQIATAAQDADLCHSSFSPQVLFIDDGIVVPGTGGSSCVTWCYGPGGYVVNTTGGLLGEGNYLDNGILSPPLAWPEGCDDLLVSFDVYVHEMLGPESAGVVYRWRVRSTDDENPGDLAQAPWRSRDGLMAGGPEYRRHNEPCGDLLVPGRQWIQLELEVLQAGHLWGLDGHDASPAPWFDNVALSAYPATGPRLVVDDRHLPQDTFPESGIIEYEDLAQNSCRFDMARNISPPEDGGNDPGDSVVIEVHALRENAVLKSHPRMMVRLQANPLFKNVRTVAPSPEGMIDLVVPADSCRAPDGTVLAGRWAFDLPDTGLVFPGDIIHFFFEATTLADGGAVTVTWPADTTGFADFDWLGPWPEAAVMRALPTMTSIDPDDQPDILLWRDEGPDQKSRNLWTNALSSLDLVPGVGVDVYYTRAPDAGLGNGLGGRATATQLMAYETLVYDCGAQISHTLSNGDVQSDPSPDLALLQQWFQELNRHAFLMGDNLASDLDQLGGEGSQFLTDIMGVEVLASDASIFLGGQYSPSVFMIPDTSFKTLLNEFVVLGSCPDIRTFDALMPVTAEPLARFQGPNEALVGDLSAMSRQIDGEMGRDVMSMPLGFATIHDVAGGGGQTPGLSSRIQLLAEVLTSFGNAVGPPLGAVDIPEALGVACYPNPFNPRVTIRCSVPKAGPVSLDVVDLRGRHVRTLLNGDQPAGTHEVIWNGCDGAGRPCASGIYFHVLKTSAGKALGKMTLVR